MRRDSGDAHPGDLLAQTLLVAVGIAMGVLFTLALINLGIIH